MSSSENEGDHSHSPPPPQIGEVEMETLLEFQQITGVEDIDVSRQILDRHNWDIIAAINGQMGFEPPMDPPPFHNHNHFDAQNPTTSRRGHGNPVSSNPTASSSSDRAPAVPARRPQSFSIFSWVWKVFTAPMEFFFRYLWNFIGYGLQFIRGDPRRAITDPTADVDDFVRRYEAEFGSVHPDFYRGTYSQALQEAKKELKFLLVYLHCDDHIDTAPFCRLVMPNQGFRDLIRENMIFWACSVSKPEGYRTSQALRENTYPFLALIVLKNNRMTVVARVEGVIDPEELLARLHQGVADNEAFLVAERQERLERSMTQTLRAQQDEAYQESLRADQEKDRKKREAEEKKRQAELEKQRIENEEKERKESMKQRKSVTLLNLKQEPAPDAPNVIRCIIKLPNGQRLERRFLSSDSLKHLYNFVFSHPQSPDLFEIATNFPKRTLPCKPTSDDEDPPTFTEVGLQRNEMLFVYDLES